jgi:hypothetical protein
MPIHSSAVNDDVRWPETLLLIFLRCVEYKAQERIDMPYLTNIYLLTDHVALKEMIDLCFIRGNISYFNLS